MPLIALVILFDSLLLLDLLVTPQMDGELVTLLRYSW